MGVSKVDKIYRSIVLKKFFTHGWGHPEKLRRLFQFRKIISQRDLCQTLVEPNYPIHIDKTTTSKTTKIIQGHLKSPLVQHLPGMLPPESETAYFELVLPVTWKTQDKPICVHMAGTGDHYFWRRRALLAKPLLNQNHIGSLIMENPFYGLRKPAAQLRSSLLHVADIFIMGGALILESIALLRWLENEGFGPFCMHGISMGGHMASLAAASWPKPIAIAPCLSWTTASGVFTRGVMSGAIDWDVLEKQFNSDETLQKEIAPMVMNEMTDEVASRLGNSINPSTSDVKSALQKIVMSGSQVLPELVAPILPGKVKANVIDLIKMQEKRWVHDKLSVADEKTQKRIEALRFMHAIMDECTHLKNFTVPVDPSLACVVSARDDGYVLRDGYASMEEVWPGSNVNIANCGHVSAFVLYQVHFRKAIVDSLNLLKNKYGNSEIAQAV